MSSSAIHSARPLTISRSSLASSGRSGARATGAGSGERKEDLLEMRRGKPGAHTQPIERALAAQAPVRQKQEAVAHPLGVGELVDGEQEGAPVRGGAAQQIGDGASLAQ